MGSRETPAARGRLHNAYGCSGEEEDISDVLEQLSADDNAPASKCAKAEAFEVRDLEWCAAAGSDSAPAPTVVVEGASIERVDVEVAHNVGADGGEASPLPTLPPPAPRPST